MKNKSILILLLFVIVAGCNSEIKVACIGDSITDGGGNSKADFYPVQLDSMLGQEYKVLNCGESGATMQSDGNKPYWYQKDFHNVFAYQPDIIVVMLGTNDSKTENWNATSFERDYQSMLDTLSTLNTNPKVFLCSPPPAYSSAWNISDSTIRAGVVPIVERLAKKNKLKIIDVYSGMTGISDLFPDGIHPNAEGKQLMAQIIASAIEKEID